MTQKLIQTASPSCHECWGGGIITAGTYIWVLGIVQDLAVTVHHAVDLHGRDGLGVQKLRTGTVNSWL